MNLKDRTNSDSSSLQPNRNLKRQEDLKKNENMQNMNNTSQRSKQLSPDIIMKKQSETIQQLTTENMTLRKQIMERNEGNPDTEQTISDLSSQISMLKKKVLDQKQEIVDLNEKNAKLNSSDLQLKEARSMKEQAEQDMREATTLVSDFEKHKESVIAAFNEREIAISDKEKRIKAIKSDLEGEIGKRVDMKVDKIKCKLDTQYSIMEIKLEKEMKEQREANLVGYVISILIAVFSVIGVFIISKPLRKETSEFISSIFGVTKSIFLFPINTGVFFATEVCHEVEKSNEYYLYLSIVGIVLYLIMGIILVLVGIFLYRNIEEDIWDGYTVVAILIVNWIIVFFTPVLKKIIKMNLFSLGGWILVVYMIVRFLIEWDWSEMKKKILASALYITGSVTVIGFLIRNC